MRRQLHFEIRPPVAGERKESKLVISLVNAPQIPTLKTIDELMRPAKMQTRRVIVGRPATTKTRLPLKRRTPLKI